MQQTDAEFEVIVADIGSSDDTASIVRAYDDPRIHLIDAGQTPGVSVGRNAGVAASRGKFILLTDGADIVQDGWIESHHKAFVDGAHAVGGGLDRILEDGTILAKSRQFYPTLFRRNIFAIGTNCGFSREAFDRVGGFDENFSGGADEVDFFWRLADAGYRVTFVEGAVVSKVHRADQPNTFTQHYIYGKGEARLINKFRPGLLEITMVLATVQSCVWGIAWAITIGQRTTVRTLAFNLGLLTESARLIVTRPPRQRLARLVQSVFIPRGV